MSETISVFDHGITPSYEPLPALPGSVPRTELGRRLREIRSRIVASGAPLLDWKEFEREMRERRGQREEDE